MFTRNGKGLFLLSMICPLFKKENEHRRVSLSVIKFSFTKWYFFCLVEDVMN